jgi:hypothetical protein
MNYLKIAVGSKNYKLETPSTFADFLSRLSKKLGPSPLESHDLSYIDDEQQSVSIQCEEDFQLALQHAARPLRFTLRPHTEADASNEDIFRLSNLCEYIVKIEDEIETASTKLTDALPFSAPLLLGQFPSFMPLKSEFAGQEASPSVRREAVKSTDAENPIEASILSLLNLLVLSKLKCFVLDQFRDICAKPTGEVVKRDHNSTKSTLAINLSDISAHRILVDHFLPPADEPPNIFRTETRPPRLTNLAAFKGRLTRTRRVRGQ